MAEVMSVSEQEFQKYIDRLSEDPTQQFQAMLNQAARQQQEQTGSLFGTQDQQQSSQRGFFGGDLAALGNSLVGAGLGAMPYMVPGTNLLYVPRTEADVPYDETSLFGPFSPFQKEVCFGALKILGIVAYAAAVWFFATSV